MTEAQISILAILAATVGLFLWGRFRHDVVALAALLAAVIAGVVPGAAAFQGFAHPAVITVASVLILSRGLQNSGAVDLMAGYVIPRGAGRMVSLLALCGLGAALSGFMNNVGAMALLMPVAVQLAGRLDLAPGQVLMPLAFSTILGGMTTLVGTPPNLIVSGFRAEAGLGAFGMFAFTPVGLAVALAGLALICTIGWRLVPARKAASGDEFETGAYMTEARVPEGAKAVDQTLREIETVLEAADAQVLALIRGTVRLDAPRGSRRVQAGDVLVLEAAAADLGEALARLGLVLEAADEKAPKEEAMLREYVVRPGSPLEGRSARDLRLRSRHGVNLVAVSREGRRSRARLRTLRIRSGDLILMQGPLETLSDFASDMGAVPLAEREIGLRDRKMAALSVAIMAGSVGLAAFGLLPAAVAFALGVLATMLAQTVPLRNLYNAIDWPIIVLLAALIPVAGAMETTGAAELLARFLVDTLTGGSAIGALALVLVVTMTLSDVMNNAATAAVMCPIALGIAATLGVSPDSFLMAVAIGASCAFLTPIGHQNNTLILGPGGFAFSDYWRLGLPMEVLVVGVSLPLLLVVWPL